MLLTFIFHFSALPYYCNVSHNFTTTVIVTIILNQKKNRPWYSPLIDCWSIPNMMLYFINFDAAVVWRPSPTNCCFVYNLSCLLFFSLSDYAIPPFLLQIPLFLRFYYSFFFSFSTDWRWVSRCFCGQLPSCLLSLIVEYKFILPSWSCRNLMVDLLTNSLFWIAR